MSVCIFTLCMYLSLCVDALGCLTLEFYNNQRNQQDFHLLWCSAQLNVQRTILFPVSLARRSEVSSSSFLYTSYLQLLPLRPFLLASATPTLDLSSSSSPFPLFHIIILRLHLLNSALCLILCHIPNIPGLRLYPSFRSRCLIEIDEIP